MLGDVKKRCVQFVVKSAIGRFVKDVSKRHMDEPVVGWDGLSFELHNLELNEAAVNREVLADFANIRLVNGYIGSMKGEIMWSLQQPRNLEIQNVDLTFCFLGNMRPRPAGQSPPAAEPPIKQSLYTSMLAGELTAEILREEVLQQSDEEASIDQGVSVLSTVIKSLVHNTRGDVKSVTLRMRVPPPGQEIVLGEQLPDGTMELLLHMPEVRVIDETDPDTSIANSFRKRITSNGLVVHIYPAAKRFDTVEEGFTTQRLRMEDAVMINGDLESVKNEILVQFFDIEKAGAPRWRVDFGMAPIQAIFTPTQLTNLIVAAKLLARAPEAQSAPQEDSVAPSTEAALSDQQPTVCRFECTLVSCALLHSDTPDVVRLCWKNLRDGRDVYSALTTAHYSLTLEKLVLLISAPIEARSIDSSDPMAKVFQLYGGRYLAVALKNVQLDEKQPNRPRACVMKFGPPPPDPTGTAVPAQSKYQVTFSMRTTCPIPPDLARSCGLVVEDDQTNVVRQTLKIETFSPVEVFTDVLVLDRFLFYYKTLDDYVTAASVARSPAGLRQESEFSLSDLDNMRPLTEEEVERGARSRRPIPLVERPSSHYSLYSTQKTTTVDVSQLTVEVLFPCERRPSPDLYGPHTQRLFKTLLGGTVAEGGTAFHLRKALVFELYRLWCEVLPTRGGVTVAQCKVQRAKLSLKDTMTMERTILAEIDLASPAQSSKNTTGITFVQRETVSQLVVASKDHFLPSDTDARIVAKENELFNSTSISLSINVHSARFRMHQDELLLIIFMADEIVECAISAIKRAQQPSPQLSMVDSANQETAGGVFLSALDHSVLPTSGELVATTSVRIYVKSVHFKLRAARLSGELRPVGEPLWMLLSPEDRAKIDQNTFFHTYEIRAYNIALFVFNHAATTVTNTLINVRGDHAEMLEVSPKLPRFENEFVPPATHGTAPKWGQPTPLIRSYATLYDKSSGSAAPSPHKCVRAFVQRIINIQAKTLEFRIDAELERVAVCHTVAHEKDHWLFVLMGFFADAPEPQPPDDSSVESEEIVAPYSCVTDFKMQANDILFEYHPFGGNTMAVLLVQRGRVDTGRLLAYNPRASIMIELEKVALYLNDDFPLDLVEYDAQQGNASVFGGSKAGIAEDLSTLGFVPILHLNPVSAPALIALRFFEVSGKPVVVEISNLTAEFNVACDSFNLFVEAATTFFTWLDLRYIPSPYLLVGSNGAQFLKERPKTPPAAGPTINILAPDLEATMERILHRTFIGDAEAPTGGKRVEQISLRQPPSYVYHGPSVTRIRHGEHPDDHGFIDIDVQPAQPPSLNWTIPEEPGAADAAARAAFSLPSLVANPKYFSLHSSHRSRGQGGIRAAPLAACPPVEVETLLSGVQLHFNLFSGVEFGPVLHDVDDYDSAWFGYSEDYRTQVKVNGQRVVRTTKSPYPFVKGVCQGLFVQIDIFEEGRDKSMQLLCSVNEIEFIDCLKTSPVRSLLRCTLPQSHRDIESPVIEIKWVTTYPKVGGIQPKPEEQLSVRCQPLWLCFYQETMMLLLPFFNPPTPEAPPSTMFFNKLFVHPIDIAFSWYPREIRSYAAVARLETIELMTLLTVEGARVKLRGFVVANTPMEDLAWRIYEAVYPQVNPNILLLLCGLSPVRSVSEITGAVGDLILKPIAAFHRNKSLYAGITQGLTSFSRRLSGEGFRLGSSTSMSMHRVIHSVAQPVQPAAHHDPMTRGDQPIGVNEGIQRGAAAVSVGVAGVAEGLTVCVGEEGSYLHIPLVALIPVDGVLRGITEILRGFRNWVRPDVREIEVAQFKKK